MRRAITDRYPDLPIDWAAIDRTLAQGPPGTPSLAPDAEDWAAVEHHLLMFRPCAYIRTIC